MDHNVWFLFFNNYIKLILYKLYSAYHQIVTIKIAKNRNYLEEFSSLVVFLVDNFQKIAKRNYLVVGTVTIIGPRCS